MAEYIDKSELQERVAQYFVDFNTDKYDICKDVVEVIEDTPTIDIVHCRYCKHFEDNKGIDGEYCRHNGFGVSSDWFCADGKRKEE